MNRHLGWLLLAVLLGALLLKGAAEPWTRALVMLAVAALLVPASRTEELPDLRPWLAAWGVGLAGMAIAWLPLPRGLLQWVAPGIVAARPDLTWHTLGLRPEAVVGEMATWTLVMAFGALVTVWLAGGPRRDAMDWGATALAAVLGWVSLAHHRAGSRAVFGVLPVRLDNAERLFLPLVDTNHLGAAIAMVLPLVVGQLLDRRSAVPKAATAFALLPLLWIVAISHSAGTVLVAGGVTALTVWHKGVPARIWVPGALVGSAGLAWALSRSSPNATSRLDHWRDALVMVGDHWLAGVGAGAYGIGVEPYRSDLAFGRWLHAHNGVVEVLGEGGLVGLLAMAAAVWLLRPPRLPQGRRAARVRIGLLGVAVMTLAEFPLQISSLALMATLGWAFGVRGAGGTSPRWHGVLWIPALGVSALWMARTELADRAANTLRNHPADTAAQQTLVWTAPWRPERLLHSDPERLAFHDEGAILLRVAANRARKGDTAGALQLVGRAQSRAPADYRVRVLRARLSQGEDAAREWVAAFARGAPERLLGEAYRSLPIGLWWVEQLRDQRPRLSYELAVLLLRDNDPFSARIAMDQAAQQRPDYARHPFRARLWSATGDEAGAERILLEALSERPTDPGLLHQHARWLAKQGRLGEARDQMLAAARRRQDLRPGALRVIAKADGIDAARSRYDAWRQVGVADPRLSLAMARLHHEAQQSARCIEVLGHIHALDANSAVGREAQQLDRACAR